MFVEGLTVFSEQEHGKITETHMWLEACGIGALLLLGVQLSCRCVLLTRPERVGWRRSAELIPARRSAALSDTSLWHRFPNHSPETGAFLQKPIYMM